MTNLTLLEDEFEYRIITKKAGKKVPYANIESPPEQEKTKQPRTPCVKELLQKAIKWQAFLDSGEVASRSEIARREGISPARVTQVMYHLRLAPEIQEYILVMPETTHRPVVSVRYLRAITKIENHREQKEAFAALLDIEVRSENG